MWRVRTVRPLALSSGRARDENENHGTRCWKECSRRPVAAGAAAALALLVAGLVACATGQAGAADTAAVRVTFDTFEQFNACVRDAGVDVHTTPGCVMLAPTEHVIRDVGNRIAKTGFGGGANRQEGLRSRHPRRFQGRALHLRRHRQGDVQRPPHHLPRRAGLDHGRDQGRVAEAGGEPGGLPRWLQPRPGPGQKPPEVQLHQRRGKLGVEARRRGVPGAPTPVPPPRPRRDHLGGDRPGESQGREHHLSAHQDRERLDLREGK